MKAFVISFLVSMVGSKELFNLREGPHSTHCVQYPQEVPNWGKELDSGEITGIATDHNDDVYILVRGSAPVSDPNKEPIKEPTIWKISKTTGKVLEKYGANMFYHPHGLHIDPKGNIWVTDTTLHQVFKFRPYNLTEPVLTLGVRGEFGDDRRHFCKPTDLAVATTGHIVIADGYCNSRIVVYTRKGIYSHEIVGDWNVVHNIELLEHLDLVCIANREGGEVECVKAGLQDEHEEEVVPSVDPDTPTEVRFYDVGRVFAVAGRNDHLYVVSGGPTSPNPATGYILDIMDGSLVATWGSSLLKRPHELSVSKSKGEIYVTEGMPRTVRKFTLKRMCGVEPHGGTKHLGPSLLICALVGLSSIIF